VIVHAHQNASSGECNPAARLRAGGIILAYCNTVGDLISPLPGNGWLTDLLCCSPLVRNALRGRAARWIDEHDEGPRELLPGLWCAAVEIVRRKKRTGYALLLIPTRDLLESEHLSAMCQSAAVDFSVTVASLRSLALPPQEEAPRIALLAREILIASEMRAADQRTLEGIGQQLAESYEEISLLYMIGQSMTVVQRPHQFIRNTCAGLLETLPYQWVGVQFADEIPSLPQLSGKLFAAGADQRSTERYSVLTKRLLHFAHADAPVVLDPHGKPEHAEFAPLGDPILLQPISREGRVTGVFVASGKIGTDRAASSVDLKLLGATATHTAIFLENAALYEDMDAMFVGMLEAISAAIDAKDPYTCGHSRRVAHLSQQLARAAGMDDELVRRVHVAGLVHDVGKIGVPEAVLGKPGRLTPEEFELIRQHPEIGHRILKDIPQLRDVLPGVLHHHERWDGGGYPHGLRGPDIPLFARVIALADSFDAMSSTRTYRSAKKRAWVIDEIRRSAGTQFDPELAPVFVSLDFSSFDELISEHRATEEASRRARGNAA